MTGSATHRRPARANAGTLRLGQRDIDGLLMCAGHADAPYDPALLDELPLAGDIVTAAPDRIKAATCAAFDIHALYRKDLHQVTIWAPSPPPPRPGTG